MDTSGWAFGNNGRLTKPLKSLVNRNGIFEYDTQLSPLDAPYVAKNIQSQALVPQQWIRSYAAKITKR